MAQHIYMSTAPYTQELSAKLQEVAEDVITQEQFDAWLAGQTYNYRGEAGPEDDAHSFKRYMAKKGHDVIIKADASAGTEKGILRSTLIGG